MLSMGPLHRCRVTAELSQIQSTHWLPKALVVTPSQLNSPSYFLHPPSGISQGHSLILLMQANLQMRGHFQDRKRGNMEPKIQTHVI